MTYALAHSMLSTSCSYKISIWPGALFGASSDFKGGNLFHYLVMGLFPQFEKPSIAILQSGQTGSSTAHGDVWLKLNARTRLRMELMRMFDVNRLLKLKWTEYRFCRSGCNSLQNGCGSEVQNWHRSGWCLISSIRTDPTPELIPLGKRS